MDESKMKAVMAKMDPKAMAKHMKSMYKELTTKGTMSNVKPEELKSARKSALKDLLG